MQGKGGGIQVPTHQRELQPTSRTLGSKPLKQAESAKTQDVVTWLLLAVEVSEKDSLHSPPINDVAFVSDTAHITPLLLRSPYNIHIIIIAF